MGERNHIPRIPHAFFKWYCKNTRYEELQGDLEEFFHERVESQGLVRARILYWRDVIRCFQPYAWKKNKGLSNSNIMFKNYFKTSLRGSLRNPLSTFINIFGLAVAIGICIVVYAFIMGDYSIDRFHKNSETVFLTTFYADRNGHETQFGTSPAPLAQRMAADFPEVKNVSRIMNQNAIVKHEDRVFYERIRLCDPEFLDMFTFPLKWGDKTTLNDPNTIILSSRTSQKYFGDENPVGRDLQVRFNDRNKVFRVIGVAAPFPKARTIDFSLLANFENVRSTMPRFQPEDWAQLITATFVQVERPEDIQSLLAKMDEYRVLQNKSESDWEISAFNFHQLGDLHLSANEISNNISRDTVGAGRSALPIIGLVMVVLASLNYINMAISSSSRRLKEIGVRKVIGANRKKILVQFLIENVLTTFLALVLAIGLAFSVFHPWFYSLSQLPMDLTLLDLNFWIFLLLLTTFTGVLSGIYPALYISRFHAAKIFRGNIRFGSKNPMTKIFLGFQLILACITITGAIVFSQNSTYQTEQDWGYASDNVIYLGIPDQPAYSQFQGIIDKHPQVVSSAPTTHHIGRGHRITTIKRPDRKLQVQELSIGPGYTETMGVNILQGRFFSDEVGSDQKSILINETLRKRLGLDDPLSQQLQIDSTNYQVVGVFNDFHSYNFGRSIQPTIFRLAEPDQVNFMAVKAIPGQESELLSDLREIWASEFPDEPLNAGFQKDVWGNYFGMIEGYASFNKAIAIIAVLLATSGLFGLVALNVSGRRKEFSIRKVLGAGASDLAQSIGNKFVLLAGIAMLIGVPASYFVVKFQLALVFAYPLTVNFKIVLISALILIGIIICVMLSQLWKVLKSSPIHGLRVEAE